MPSSDVSRPARGGAAGPIPSETVESQAILQKVLAELKVSELSIPAFDKRGIVELDRRNLNAFAVSPTDLARTHLVTHRIDTGDNPPFKEILRAVPHAWREFLEQELDRLLSVGAISEADPGECPYASRYVIVRIISAFRWIQVDRQKYDDIYVVNFEVLNRAYREMLRVALPGVRVDDVEFS